MRIGELAALVGLSTATIRFYERTGVLAPARRAANGYREYSERAVAELKFVRAGQAIGLTLEELGEIVAFRDHGESPCAELVALMERRLGEVEARLEELGQIRRDLVTLVAAARGADFDDCPQPRMYAMLTPDVGTPTSRDARGQGLAGTSGSRSRRSGGSPGPASGMGPAATLSGSVAAGAQGDPV